MKTFSETLVSDFLSEVTRRERRSLLGLSALAIAIVQAGLVPTKISTFGIDFNKDNQDSLLTVFAFVVGYYTVAFITYGLSDFALWRHQFFEALYQETGNIKQEFLEAADPDQEDPMEEHMLSKSESRFILRSYQRAYSGRRRWRRLMPYVSVVRAAFDFLLPILVAGYAVIILLSR